MSRQISTFGTIVTITAVIVFTVLTYQMVGWWCVIVGPFIAMAACRPPEGSDRCAWEKSYQTVDEFISSNPPQGDVNIMYKGETKVAWYNNYNARFQFGAMDTSCYMRECITEVWR